MEEIHQTAFEAHLEQLCGLEDANLSDPLEAQIEQAMKKDQTMITLKEIIIEGWPNRKSEVAPEVRMYYDFRDELVVYKEMVFKGQRCVVPESVRPEVLKRIHQAHIGREGCIRRARNHVYWPGMTAQIKDYVSRCETCLKVFQETAEGDFLSTGD